MAWNCACQNHVPDTPPYSWPITIAECQGKEASCSQQCNYGVTQNVCLKGCKRYFKCNKPGGPKSGLQVKDENQLPDYDLPVA
ncbi:hypothetical protein BDF20DRAFT_804540, partial [Mycotypha africana]|uniref:uncharacterized protein n=1 Tax=Mycotypha africana TaxID=64632 RepID=UPI00230062FC